MALAIRAYPNPPQTSFKFSVKAAEKMVYPRCVRPGLRVVPVRVRRSRGSAVCDHPVGVVGALLILAGTDLAISRRPFDGKPSCWWVIGVTALVTLTVNPALGLVLGWITEFIRAAVVRRLIPERPRL